MARFALRAFLLCIGVFLAAAAGVVFIGLSAFFSPAAGVILLGAVKAAVALVLSMFDGLYSAVDGIDSISRTARALAAALVVPALLTGVAAEAFALRSALFHIVASAALAALIPLLLMSGALDASGVKGMLLLLFALTGAVSGEVYWVIAGRTAGRDLPLV